MRIPLVATVIACATISVSSQQPPPNSGKFPTIADVFHPATFAARRARLASLATDGLVVLFGEKNPIDAWDEHANDPFFKIGPFRQEENFFYLTRSQLSRPGGCDRSRLARRDHLLAGNVHGARACRWRRRASGRDSSPGSARSGADGAAGVRPRVDDPVPTGLPPDSQRRADHGVQPAACVRAFSARRGGPTPIEKT